MILKQKKTKFASLASFLLYFKSPSSVVSVKNLPYNRGYSRNRLNQEFGRRFQTNVLKNRQMESPLWLESEDEIFFRELGSLSMSMSMSFSYNLEFQIPSTDSKTNSLISPLSSSPTSSPFATPQSLSPSKDVSSLIPTSADSTVPSLLPTSTISVNPSSLISENPSKLSTLVPSASLPLDEPVFIRTCESSNMTEASTSNITVEEINFTYSAETINDSDIFISSLEEKMLNFVADEVLDCDRSIRARRMKTSVQHRHLSLQQLDSRPVDVISKDEICVPSTVSNLCTVVDAYMTMTVEAGHEEAIRLQVLTAISDAMERNIFLSSSLQELAKLSYLAPNITLDQNLEPQTRINSAGLSDGTKDTSSSNLIYSFFGIIPLVIGFSAFLSVHKRDRLRTVPGRKNGFIFHQEEAHTDSDANSSSMHSVETEGEFVGGSPLCEHQSVVLANKLDPQPPVDSQLSPSTQATHKIKNTSNLSKKSLFEI